MNKLSFALVFLVLACGSPKKTELRRQQFEASSFVQLTRTSCFGTCPSYDVRVSGTGKVVFTGKQHTKIIGEATSQLDEAAMEKLVVALNEADFLNLRNYVEVKISDYPSATITLDAVGASKKVEHYQGDEKAPAELKTLEDKIDEILGTKAWIQ